MCATDYHNFCNCHNFLNFIDRRGPTILFTLFVLLSYHNFFQHILTYSSISDVKIFYSYCSWITYSTTYCKWMSITTVNYLFLFKNPCPEKVHRRWMSCRHTLLTIKLKVQLWRQPFSFIITLDSIFYHKIIHSQLIQ